VSTGIVYLRPTPLLYVRASGTRAQAGHEAWSRLLQWIDIRGFSGEIQRKFGLMRDDVDTIASGQTRYEACVEAPQGLIEDPAEGVGMMILPGGPYVRHRHTTGRDEITKTLRWLTGEWAASRSMDVDKSRPMIEAYTCDPLADAARLRLDVCVPVQIGSNRRSAA